MRLIKQSHEIKETKEAKEYLFFDTETSGFPKKLAADHREQSWCCQLGAMLTNEKGETIEELDMLIKANGRKLSSFITGLTGITVKMTMEDGVEEVEVLENFAKLLVNNPKKVCHNYAFDSQFLEHLFVRNMEKLSDFARPKYFLEYESFCTMKDKRIVTFCGLKNKGGYPKWPKLEELYRKLFEKDFENAHNAMADVRATKDCFFELIKRGVILGEER